ncbi:MAG: tetratricopeptide repeat protein [Pirellulales bacterium]|nr:tetratricopeptide repeat protein [Pirellulales bacterium]
MSDHSVNESEMTSRWWRGHFLLGAVAVLLVIAGIAYGGYRIFVDGKMVRNAKPYNPDYIAIARQLAVQGKFEAAIDVYEGILREGLLKRRPQERREAKAWLGCCYNALGQHAQAIEVYKAARREFPPETNNRYFLACSYASLGKDKEALQALWEYLLLGGQLPRQDKTFQDKTFKVAHQLHRLEDEGRIQKLLNKPQLPFGFLLGCEVAVSDPGSLDIGVAITEIQFKIPFVKISFWPAPGERLRHQPWDLVFQPDIETDQWQAHLITDSSGIGEFKGTVLPGQITMTGKWIPPTGGPEVLARLEIQQQQSNSNASTLRMLLSPDGSGDWPQAEMFLQVRLMRN